MPKLKRRVSDGGWYTQTRGHVSPVNTWQVGPEALRWLGERGVADVGDPFTYSQFCHLRDCKWIKTGGGGPSQPPESVTPATWASAFEWARGAATLAALATHNPNDLDWLFPPELLGWLRATAPGGRLGEWDGASPDSVARSCPVLAPDSPLTRLLDRAGGDDAAWKLARLVGAAANALRGDQSPVGQLLDRVAARAEAAQSVAAPRRWRPPQLVWEVDGQRIVVHIPAQNRPRDEPAPRWCLDRERVAVACSPSAAGRHYQLGISQPVRSTAAAKVELRVGQDVIEQWRLAPPGDAEVLLFDTSNAFLDPDAPDPLLPGEYNALIRTPDRNYAGVSISDSYVIPAGWHGFAARRVAVAPGAELPGYRVAGNAVASWRFDDPPDRRVAWCGGLPVYAGAFPSIRVRPGSAITGRAVEIARLDQLELVPVVIPLGSEFLTPGADGTGVIDLSKSPAVAGLFGQLRVRCWAAGPAGDAPLVLAFVRLPAMDIRNVPDPSRPHEGTAIAVECEAELVAGAGTVLSRESGGVVLSARTPHTDPVVTAADPTAGWEVRVMVGVTRGAVVTQGELPDWQPLPIRGIDLASIGTKTDLHVESPFPLDERDQPMTVDIAGQPSRFTTVGDLGHDRRLYTIPLHRWRDGFAGICGMAKVRGPHSWVPVFELGTNASPGSDRAATEPLTGWRRLEADLRDATSAHDSARVASLAAECLSLAASTTLLDTRDLLPIAVAKAALAVPGAIELEVVADALAPLSGRDDLRDARALAAVVGMRLGTVDPDAARDATEGYDGARAEAWYRFARTSGGPAPGAWVSCRERSQAAVSGRAAEAVTPQFDAAILMLLAGLNLPDPVAGGVDFATPTATRAWLEALVAATQFVRTSWRKPEVPGRSPLTGHAAPAVLLPQDAALVRFVSALAAGDPASGEDWQAVRELPGYFYWGLPLLRARYAACVGDTAMRDAEYQLAMDEARGRGDGTVGFICGEWM